MTCQFGAAELQPGTKAGLGPALLLLDQLGEIHRLQLGQLFSPEAGGSPDGAGPQVEIDQQSVGISDGEFTGQRSIVEDIAALLAAPLQPQPVRTASRMKEAQYLRAGLQKCSAAVKFVTGIPGVRHTSEELHGIRDRHPPQFRAGRAHEQAINLRKQVPA
ncbi:MAG: hypothetical protein ACO3NZ_13710 [Pirellulales bacterium]